MGYFSKWPRVPSSPARTVSRFCCRNRPRQDRIGGETYPIRCGGDFAEIAAQPHPGEIVVQRRQIGLGRQDCLVLKFILVYICLDRRRTGIWIAGLVDDLVTSVRIESRNCQRYDGKAGWPPQRSE